MAATSADNEDTRLTLDVAIECGASIDRSACTKPRIGGDPSWRFAWLASGMDPPPRR